MKPKIDMIGIITNKFEEMKEFYSKVLGFKIQLEMEQYVEFENEGTRFAISTNKVMSDVTNHSSYKEEKKGQSLELAFRVNTPEEVDSYFQEIIDKGATSIKEPANMPWGQRAAFFADPDENIHEIFTDLK